MKDDATRRDLILLGVMIALLVAVDVALVLMGRMQTDSGGFGIMVAAGITVGMYSFLYKDNPLFKAVEHLYVGVAAGYVLSITWYNIFLPDVIRPLLLPEVGESRDFLKLIPLVLGVLMLMRMSKRYSWVSRISFAFVMGFYSGLAITNYLETIIFKHLSYSVMPLFDAGTLADQINAVVVLVGVLSVLVYFWFSVEHKGPVKAISRVGVYFLMISFGASFGYTIMARLSLLVERLEFLMHDWLGWM